MTYISADRLITAEDADLLIRVGGYVHPLFTDPAFLIASPFSARPLPGQALLLLLGGLAEQTDAYDERTLALLGFEHVAFRTAAVEGDRVHVEVEQLADESERVTRWTWRGVREDGVVLVEAVARFLVRRG